MEHKFQNSNSKNSGFTLVEMLVAVSVLLVAILGPLSISSQGLSTSGIAREAVTASYLAQEGEEIVRSVRDDNSLAGATWLQYISKCIGKSCVAHPTVRGDEAIEECPAPSPCDPLKYDDARKLYQYDTGDVSPFTREIRIEKISDSEIRVLVTVSWKRGLLDKSFALNAQLYDWK